MTALSLDELRRLRTDLQEFCRLGAPSIWDFFDRSESWFRLTLDDEPTAGKAIAHLTTTLTCLEALAERPLNDEDIAELAEISERTDVLGLNCDKISQLSYTARLYVVSRKFANRALAATAKDWRSDGAAFIYCRVRTLGALLRLLRSNHDVLTDSNGHRVEELLAQAWCSHVPDGTFGLRECAEGQDIFDKPEAELRDVLGQPDSSRTYVPNAFLTYWGMLAVAEAPEGVQPPDWAKHLLPAAREWLSKSQAQQVTFRYSGSKLADPQQLAWAVCAQVRFAESDDLLVSTTVEHAQLSASLNAFFNQQLDDGSWPVGQPLFHYPHAGNAYCYIFETVGELLSLATRRGRHNELLRRELRPYGDRLLHLFELAQATSQPLGGQIDRLGWSSGHNARRVQPEAWATASVFRFAQAFRRLAGMWANEEAQALLGARTALVGREELRERGGTWNLGRGSTGVLLGTGFLNPIERQEARREAASPFAADPDVEVVPEHAASSAILFGPPGTGKTTLIEAIAGALEWPFIELNPADVLDQGVNMVSARADELFSRIMELDRCVVLLDEIDELIRRRSDRAESVERMFTTTMLPRLTKLWKQKKILFFVNTNSILDVDPAIRRNQRFDFAIFVLPPGWRAKQALLARQDVTLYELDEKTLTKHMLGAEPHDAAWFGLLTYPQLLRLAKQLGRDPNPMNVSTSTLTTAMKQYTGALQQADWAEEDQNGKPVTKKWPTQFAQLEMAQRRDPDVRLIARIEERAVTLATSAGLVVSEDGYVEIPDDEDNPDEWPSKLPQEGLLLRPDGVLDLDGP